MSNYSGSEFNFNDENSSWTKTFNLIPEKSLVLDVGCSSGNFGAELIRRKHCTVDGIEIDDSDRKEASRKLRKVYDFDIERDELVIDERYDVVFMGDVIEHLARPIPALRSIKKLLKKDGRLVYSIPNINHMSVRLMLMEGDINYGKTGLLDETHLHFYNSKEIYRIFTSAGYEFDVFGYTVNDIPLPAIEKRLRKIGLVPNATFKEYLTTLDAAAYQFVGSAKVAKSMTQKPAKLPSVSPLNIVDTYTNELRADYQKNVQAVAADRDRILAEFEAFKQAHITVKKPRLRR